jgi:uncharacterized SAM-binding protein YcdF (DUF218 family)
MKEKVQNAVGVIWQYMHVGEEPSSADCLLVLGSRDDRVAEYAAKLAERFRFGVVAVTGGSAHHDDLLATAWQEKCEAEHFAQVMRKNGMTRNIILEAFATNTGENATFTYNLLKSRAKVPHTLVIVTKPYMERRTLATFEKQWPDTKAKFIMASPPHSFTDYCNDEQPVDTVINIMVGDLQRIMKYPALGYQSEQAVPSEVLKAYQVLIDAGYTKHLMKLV